MKKKLLMVLAVIYAFTTVFIWFFQKQTDSLDERRKLALMPTVSVSNILNGSFSDDFENYAKDQFPYRFQVRQLKALSRYYGLAIRENNDFYIEDNKAIKIEYPLKENEIIKAAQKFEEIISLYVNDESNIYFSIIPDKSYYSKHKNTLKLDYEVMEKLLLDNLHSGEYINIKSDLTLNDYYNTDIHWKQENLDKVVRTLKKSMKLNEYEYELVENEDNFKGVYYGHSALLLQSDKINSIVNQEIIDASVSTLNNDNLTVYDIDGLKKSDQYDFFLHGSEPIVKIKNEHAKNDKNLIMFRDSFASSLAPYFINDYSEIVLIDIRYISTSLLPEYVDFNVDDVIFIYSGNILNRSSLFK